ncbi:MAG: response regulator [Candidatus Mcinerneyibacterium aminivorans]|uniref:Response regulator n=1 Tax=Candidatus Mcinerneyibacterium aminivorans TaxID=2703815 RepID=A0A5D0MET2_9BACT|nr:MAG: response regulator [Candidatus Mcinerneyibacterium aminivorans]
MKRIKILLVDDNKSLSFGLKEYLQDYNMNVSIVNSAEKAFEKYKIDEFDVIIVDLRLPGMNGEDFILSCERKYNNLKYIIYTGSSDYTLKKELKNSANLSKNIIKKPLNGFKKIKKEIDSLIGDSDNCD